MSIDRNLMHGRKANGFCFSSAWHRLLSGYSVVAYWSAGYQK